MILSSAVTATFCNKTDYSGTATGGLFNADCRKIDNPSVHLFSWCMVQQYADQLCTNGWRVPTKEDFCKIATGSTATCTNGTGGYANWWEDGIVIIEPDGTPEPLPRAEFSDYWSQSESDLWNGYNANVRLDEYHFAPAGNMNKGYGLVLRCVKDK
jgi:hypothetical protein